MKLNLPTEVIMDCMERSLKFRQYAASVLTEGINKAEIESVFVYLIKSGQKIAAIKALREYSRNDKDRLDAIKSAFPSQYEDYGSPADNVLSLSASKKIVELYE
jgi:hypothetical protein